MNMRSTMSMVALALALGLAACASAGGSGSSSHFARSIGVGTAADIDQQGQRFMALNQFEMEREEAAPNIYMESRWRERSVLDDEYALGIDAAEIRATIRARPRSGTSAMGDLYTVDLIIEQRVRLANESVWTTETLTEGARELAATMAEDLRQSLDIGVRRF